METVEFASSSDYSKPKFEYFSHTIQKGRHGLTHMPNEEVTEFAQKNDDPPPHNKIGLMNYFGKQGWEYISEEDGEGGIVTLYFKRQK